MFWSLLHLFGTLHRLFSTKLLKNISIEIWCCQSYSKCYIKSVKYESKAQIILDQVSLDFKRNNKFDSTNNFVFVNGFVMVFYILYFNTALQIMSSDPTTTINFFVGYPTLRKFYPLDTGRKLNVHKTFRRRPGRYLNVLCRFNLRHMSRGFVMHKYL